MVNVLIGSTADVGVSTRSDIEPFSMAAQNNSTLDMTHFLADWRGGSSSSWHRFPVTTRGRAGDEDQYVKGWETGDREGWSGGERGGERGGEHDGVKVAGSGTGGAGGGEGTGTEGTRAEGAGAAGSGTGGAGEHDGAKAAGGSVGGAGGGEGAGAAGGGDCCDAG